MNIAISNINIPRIESVLSKCLVNMNIKFSVESNSIGLFINLTRDGKGLAKLHATYKQKIVPADISSLLQKIGRKAEHMSNEDNIILSEYISPSAKEILQKGDVGYIEMVGNCCIKTPSISILRETEKSGRTMLKPLSNRAFTPSGLKVIFQLLNDRNAIKLNYRDLAKISGVSIDTVSKVYKDLLSNSIILKKNEKELIIANRRKLIDNWVENYNEKLRPKLPQQRFRTREKLTYSVHKRGTYWGGVSAANFWNRNELIVDNYMIYTSNDIEQVARDLKLIPDRKGNVVVYNAFWKNELLNDKINFLKNNENHTSVPFFMIYADLLSYNDVRYTEAAIDLYKAYLDDKI